VTVLSGLGSGTEGKAMPTLSYITKPSRSCWHILRPNERLLVWCQADLDGPTWTQITLKVPASICPVCLDAEAVSLAVDQGRRSRFCTEFRLSKDEPATPQVKTSAPADLRSQVEAFRVMLREAPERGLTPEEEDAIAELAETVRALLGGKAYGT
jgi:hypothetical protein